MALYRVHGDAQGDTHLASVDLPETEGADGARLRGLFGVPATGLSIGEFEHLPDLGLHAAPGRRLIVLLQGQLEVATTTGDTRVLRAADGLFADDVGSRGHYSRQVGTEAVVMVSAEMPADWEFPGSAPQGVATPAPEGPTVPVG